jgi:hypothetical protein
MTHYSGFFSNFSGSSGFSGLNTDILSTTTYSDSGTAAGTNYGARYFTIGHILVQFTDSTLSMSNFSGDGGKTITFPVLFSGNPWCVVASPSSNGQNSGQFTVRTDSFLPNQFNVYVPSGATGTGLTYIAIGPS